MSKARQYFMFVPLLLTVVVLTSCTSGMNNVESTNVENSTPETEEQLPMEFEEVSNREWSKVNKDPYSYEGQGFVLVGRIWQFDSATGGGHFLADCQGQDSGEDYLSDSKTCSLYGDPQILSDFVEDDIFSAKVVVRGVDSWETRLGGTNSAIKLEIAEIQFLRSK